MRRIVASPWSKTSGRCRGLLPGFARQAPSHRLPVVLVHGYGMSSRYMMPLALELARDFAVYAPDLPGFGRSSKPRKVLDMVELADALAAWMACISLRRAVLVGNSMARHVIVEIAVRHSDRVDCLVLQD